VAAVEIIVKAAQPVQQFNRITAATDRLKKGVKRAQEALDAAGKQGRRAGTAIKGGLDKAARSADKFADKMGNLRNVLVGIGVAEFTRRIVQQAATFEQTQLRLKLLSEEFGEFDRVQELVRRNAKDFNLSLQESSSAFSDIFARLRPLGVSLDDIQKVYAGFNATALASGTSALEASAAFRQLSQALGSGRLQGDEFRSISEQLPGILSLVADEMGVQEGQLRELAKQGKITADVLINALAEGFEVNAEKIKALIAQSPAQKFQALNNAVKGLSTSLGQSLLPVLVPVVEKITELVKIFDNFPTEVKAVAAAAVGIAGALAIVLPTLAVFIKSAGVVAGVIAKIGGAAVLAKAALIALPILVIAQHYGKMAIKANEAAVAQEELNKALNTGNYETAQRLLNKELERNLDLQEKRDELVQRIGSRGAGARNRSLLDLNAQLEQSGKNINMLVDRMQDLGKPKTEIKLPSILDTDTEGDPDRGGDINQRLSRRLELLQITSDEERAIKRLEHERADTLAEINKIENATKRIQNRELVDSIFQQESDKIRAEFAQKRYDAYVKTLENIYEQADATEILTFKQKELSDEAVRLADTINNEILTGIQGMIEGTRTLGDVASNILRKLANQFLETAIMGKQGSGGIAGSLLNVVGSLFGGGGSVKGPGDFTSPEVKTADIDFSSAFAKGGRPPVGKAALVGERGPELFVPSRAGTIVPNNQLGGSTNIVVNVDASGTEVQGNQGNADQLGRLIGQAVQAELIKQKRPGGLLTR
jgi:tape measure domain-containing protein